MIHKIIAKFMALFIYPKQFKKFGERSRIDNPLRIDGKRFITIEDDVMIQQQTWLACMPLTGHNNPALKIGAGCRIGNFNHIYSTQSIVIENNVLTADKVYISDNLHTYDNPETPILHQEIKQTSPINIGEGSWIGENVCIIGASIGKHCTIGANSVVTHNIPDYCVAVGAPARVIKKYNFESKKWEKQQ